MGNLQSLSRDGTLSKAEVDRLERRLRRLGRGRSEVARSDLRGLPCLATNPFVDRMFQMYDTDGDGLLGLDDMKQMMELFTRLRDEESRCRFAFALFDTNNDGFIDRQELTIVLQLTNKRGMTTAQLEQVVEHLLDRDGRLSYPAFRGMLQATTVAQLSL